MQLARTGIHGTQSAELTKQDFAEMIETFSQSPVYLGHDAAHKDSEPSYGKVIELNLSDDGETLYGDVVLEPEVDALFSEKKYDGWSIGCPRRRIDNKRVLHHLALLGSTKPAIPNLRQIKVSQSEYAEEISAAEYKFSGKMLEFKENCQEENMTDKEKMAALEAENKKLKEDAEKKAEKEKQFADTVAKPAPSWKDSPEFAESQKRIAELEAANRAALVKGVADKFSDRVPAGLKDKVSAVAQRLAVSKPCEFSDKDGKTESRSALDVFGDLLDGLLAAPKNDGITTRQFNAEEFADSGSGGKDAPDWDKLAANI